MVVMRAGETAASRLRLVAHPWSSDRSKFQRHTARHTSAARPVLAAPAARRSVPFLSCVEVSRFLDPRHSAPQSLAASIQPADWICAPPSLRHTKKSPLLMANRQNQAPPPGLGALPEDAQYSYDQQTPLSGAQYQQQLSSMAGKKLLSQSTMDAQSHQRAHQGQGARGPGQDHGARLDAQAGQP